MIRLRAHQLVALAILPTLLLFHVGQPRPRSLPPDRSRAEIAAVLRWEDLALDSLSRQLATESADNQQLRGERDQLKSERDSLAKVVNGLGSGPGPTASIPAGQFAPHGFPFGQCTYYVATRRDVSWSGNAIEWWTNAAGIRPRGQQPVVGAIMVSRESWYGHVAYVEAVLPDGSFVVTEMNFAGWGIVDRRTIRQSQVPVVGFIY